MIIEVFFTVILFIFNNILSLFKLPDMPALIMTALNSAVPFMTVPISIVKTYVGDSFFVVVLNLIILLISLLILLRPAIWLYNKLRGSGD